MSIKNLRVLAVIPARGGSKGIPRKNLQPVGGFSLVAHTARIAKSIKSIDAAILSTDDSDIATEGKRFGLEVPFVRPVELSGDLARSVDVWRHAWLQAEKNHCCIYDFSVLLEPTSPLRRREDVELAINTLISTGVESCFTVSPTPAHYSPQKTLLIRPDGMIDFYLPVSQSQSIRQLIPSYYHRNGICYVVSRHQLIKRSLIVAPGSLPIIIDRPIVNIDEPFDLALANWLYENQYNCASF